MDLNDYLTSNDESCVTIGFTILNNQGKTKKECMEILRHNNFKKAFKGREKPYTASTTKFYMITDNNFHAHSYEWTLAEQLRHPSARLRDESLNHN